jgi:hypothetical protein
MTNEQKSIIDSIINQFETLNKKSETKYFDPTSVIDGVNRIKKEEEECKAHFEAKLQVQHAIFERELSDLVSDLSELPNVTYSKISQWSWQLCVNGHLLVQTNVDIVKKTLSDGCTWEIYDVKPKYYVVFYSLTSSKTFSTLEDMLASDTFKQELSKRIK